MAPSESDLRDLLKLARQSLEEFTRTGTTSVYRPASEKIQERAGVFVTLRRGGELRGCIGTLDPGKPLYVSVRDMTIAAAMEDPRFDPVTEDELGNITIELSIMGPLEVVQDVTRVRIGKHGLCVVQGPRRGVYLPQVAVEQGWDVQTFVEETCRKAGLKSSAWKKSSTQLFTFETIKVSERAV